MDTNNTLKILKALLEKVGAYQVEMFHSKAYKSTTKSTVIDVVTEVDQTSEEMIIKTLSEHFPSYGFLAEESGEKDSSSEYRWVIDPLDGTTNFSSGIPIFAISVALQKNGESILAAVYIPITKDFYSSIKGFGSFKNNKDLKVNTSKALRSSVIATGFPYDRAENPINNVSEFTKMVTKVKGIRRLGAAAYDICLVAKGVFSGYWEYGLKPWDYAAALLIAVEAGAVYEMMSSREHSMIISNPLIFNDLKKTLLE